MVNALFRIECLEYKRSDERLVIPIDKEFSFNKFDSIIGDKDFCIIYEDDDFKFSIFDMTSIFFDTKTISNYDVNLPRRIIRCLEQLYSKLTAARKFSSELEIAVKEALNTEVENTRYT